MRLIIISFLFILFGCKAKEDLLINKDDQKIINDLINREKAKYYVLLKKSLNGRLKKVLKEDIQFDSELYHEFGSLRNIFSDEIIKDVFSKKEVSYLLKQIDEDFKWEQSYLGKIVVKQETAKDNYFSLSKPIYTTDSKYSIIMFSKGNYYYQIGNGGILLYVKKRNKWDLVSSFFDYVE